MYVPTVVLTTRIDLLGYLLSVVEITNTIFNLLCRIIITNSAWNAVDVTKRLPCIYFDVKYTIERINI